MDQSVRAWLNGFGRLSPGWDGGQSGDLAQVTFDLWHPHGSVLHQGFRQFFQHRAILLQNAAGPLFRTGQALAHPVADGGSLQVQRVGIGVPDQALKPRTKCGFDPPGIIGGQGQIGNRSTPGPGGNLTQNQLFGGATRQSWRQDE